VLLAKIHFLRRQIYEKRWNTRSQRFSFFLIDEDQYFAGAAPAPLHELFALDAPAAPLHELFALDSGAAEPAPVGVVEPPDAPASPPHPASRPTKMPEAAVTARVLPIFMSVLLVIRSHPTRGPDGPREVRRAAYRGIAEVEQKKTSGGPKPYIDNRWRRIPAPASHAFVTMGVTMGVTTSKSFRAWWRSDSA
jgi:hypothetical protein